MSENKDTVKGKAKQIKGILTNDDKLRTEGAADEFKGKLKGGVKKALNKAAEVAGKAESASQEAADKI